MCIYTYTQINNLHTYIRKQIYTHARSAVTTNMTKSSLAQLKAEAQATQTSTRKSRAFALSKAFVVSSRISFRKDATVSKKWLREMQSRFRRKSSKASTLDAVPSERLVFCSIRTHISSIFIRMASILASSSACLR